MASLNAESTRSIMRCFSDVAVFAAKIEPLGSEGYCMRIALPLTVLGSFGHVNDHMAEELVKSYTPIVIP
jgi:hypothetical protein